MTLWGWRFSETQNQLAAKFNNSLPFDWRLAAVDVRGSIAWALALARANVITALELEQLVAGLNMIQDEIEDDRLDFNTGEEDIHTLIERRLGEIAGPVAGIEAPYLHGAATAPAAAEAGQEPSTLDPVGRPAPQSAARSPEVNLPGARQPRMGRLPQLLGHDAQPLITGAGPG